ncbi:MAG: hypothetical protein AB7O67_02835 [Vicinamibacterales bacterium]
MRTSLTLRFLAAGALLGALVLAAPADQAVVRAQGDPNVVVPPRAYQDLQWRSVGASRGGRVTAYSGVRQQPHTFYMGATGGGVWKTEDAGITWVPIADGQMATGSIGSIDVAPSNPDIVWVGTGSAAIRSNVIIGRGVYKSTDAGRTWQFMGLKESGQIGGLRVHPTNPDIVWLAALGSPFGPTEERGIFKTTDGGKTWKKTLYIDTEHGGRDIEVDWRNPDVLYAGMYRGFRKGWDIISGGPADKGGIYKSTDGGETWTHLTRGLPSDLIGKIDLDIARSNPDVLYAMIEAPGDTGGLYRSNDAGASWTLVNNSSRLRARPFYFNYVSVNPKDENEVYVSELGFHKSTDGGKTFTSIPTPHGDNHGVWLNPDNPQIMLEVNDGGANVTLNGGRSWSSILNQPTGEYYMVSVDEQYPYRMYVPQQDNTTLILPSRPPVSWRIDHPAELWSQGPGCETGQIWARRDGKTVWGACKGEVGRYSVETGQEKMYWVYPQNRYGHDPDEIAYRFPRQTVVYISPHDERVVYQASHVLHRSTDEGVTWESISGDLTAHDPQYQIIPGNPITRDITGEEVYSSIYAMVESRLEKGVIWVGANDGPVHVSRDNGKTWTNVTPPMPPGGRIQTIEDSPHHPGTAYVAAYRMMFEHDLKPYLYKTTDYGASWTLLTDGTNGIPIDYPVRVVREDPAREGLLYAGTEFGFFVSFNDGKNWQSLQQNLPNTPVTDIRVHRNDLVISTMGRSLWIMDDITPLQQLAAMGTASAAAGAAPALAASQMAGGRGAMPTVRLFQPAGVIRYRSPASPPDPAEPEYPVTGAHFDVWFDGPPPADAKIEVKDAAGNVIRTFTVAPAGRGGGGQAMRGPFRQMGGSSAIQPKAGMQRFTWDLRHPGSWTPNAPNGGGNGPLVAPGRYTVTLTANGTTESQSFAVDADPRVLDDGVSLADLKEQEQFQLQLRDAISDARRLAQAVDQAMKKAGVEPPPPAPPGGKPMDTQFENPLQRLWAELNEAEGPYPQPMLINQLNNINRMVSQADQKVGKDAFERYNDLMKKLEELKQEFARLSPTT